MRDTMVRRERGVCGLKPTRPRVMSFVQVRPSQKRQTNPGSILPLLRVGFLPTFSHCQARVLDIRTDYQPLSSDLNSSPQSALAVHFNSQLSPNARAANNKLLRRQPPMWMPSGMCRPGQYIIGHT